MVFLVNHLVIVVVLVWREHLTLGVTEKIVLHYGQDKEQLTLLGLPEPQD